MNAENIPHREKYDALVAGFKELEPLAVELAKDTVHAASPHIAPLVGRVRACIESTIWHTKFLASQPDPKPQPSKADSTDGANAPQ